MSFRVFHQSFHELMPLVAAAATRVPEGAGMGLVYDHQLGAASDEVVHPPVRLDKIH